MKKYKVLNILTNGINSNGIASTWLSFCKELNEKAHQVPFEMYIPCDSDCSFNFIRKFNDCGVATPKLPKRDSNPFGYFFSLCRLISKEHFEVVHVNGSSSLMAIELLAAWLTGVKVRIAHSRNTTCLNPILHKLLYYPFQILCNGRLACGRDAGMWLFGSNPFTIIHNGKKLDKFKFDIGRRNILRKELGLNDKFVVGHVGRFNEQKNQSYLIDIFELLLKEVPESRLILIGDGERMSSIKHKVEEKGILNNVIFTGAIDNVNDYLQAMDVMVLPSKYEGLPNVVLEWQASGIPIVISNNITSECIVTDFVETEDINFNPQSWVDKIIKTHKKFSNRKLNSERGIYALKKNGFELSESVERLIEVYNAAIAKHSYTK